MLDEGDKAIIKEAVWEVVRDHIKTCPIRYEYRIAGLKLIIALILSGALGGGIAKLLPF